MPDAALVHYGPGLRARLPDAALAYFAAVLFTTLVRNLGRPPALAPPLRAQRSLRTRRQPRRHPGDSLLDRPPSGLVSLALMPLGLEAPALLLMGPGLSAVLNVAVGVSKLPFAEAPHARRGRAGRSCPSPSARYGSCSSATGALPWAHRNCALRRLMVAPASAACDGGRRGPSLRGSRERGGAGASSTAIGPRAGRCGVWSERRGAAERRPFPRWRSVAHPRRLLEAGGGREDGAGRQRTRLR